MNNEKGYEFIILDMFIISTRNHTDVASVFSIGSQSSADGLIKAAPCGSYFEASLDQCHTLAVYLSTTEYSRQAYNSNSSWEKLLGLF